MTKNTVPVNVTILDKEYQVSCPKDEVEGLRASADYLGLKMKDIRDSGRVHGADKVAVIAALNITHELLQQNHKSKDMQEKIAPRIKNLQEKIDLALDHSRQLEL
ncbi:MAG: cell division protein ZapA [Gammaproteobacteria bacterium]|nr:cell division protein ZapA [Gammaproteobacteria bacterium]